MKHADAHSELTPVDRLVEVAVKLFHTHGYLNVSVQDVVEAAGVSKGTFYYYLTNKADLLHRIHDKIMSSLVAEGVRILAAGETAPMKLRMLVRSQIRSVHDNLPSTAVLLRDLRYLEEPYRSQIHGKRDHFASLYEQVIREGMAAGDFRADIDPRVMTFGIIGMCNWMHQWYQPDGPLSDVQVADQFLASLLNGMLAKPA